MVTLVARLDVERVHWVGTSMGALIGMALAAQQDSPVSQAGAERRRARSSSQASIERIGELRRRGADVPVCRGGRAGGPRVIGAVRPAHRRRVALPHRGRAAQESPTAAWRLHYDPKIAEPSASRCRRGTSSSGRCGMRFAARRCVLRGAQSDLLSRETARGDDAARAEGEAGGDSRRRPRADAAARDQIAIVRGVSAVVSNIGQLLDWLLSGHKRSFATHDRLRDP